MAFSQKALLLHTKYFSRLFIFSLSKRKPTDVPQPCRNLTKGNTIKPLTKETIQLFINIKRTYMKKLYLLLTACISLCCYAQDPYTFRDRVVNGDCEGDDASCFATHEYRDGERFEGMARLVVDPTNESNHCAEVIARDMEEGESLEDWDVQFFITVAEKLEVGDEYRLTFKIRADKAANCSTQAHNLPGDYNYWSMIGDVNITTEWQTFVREGVISQQQVFGDEDPETSAKEMHTIAFNLYLLKEANKYYFDDMKWEVKKPKEHTGETTWFDMVKNGDLSTDDVSSFTGRDGIDGIDKPCRIVTLEDGTRALNVTSIAEMPIKEDGTQDDLTDWRTQFFVTIPHVFRYNQKYKFEMDYRSDVDATVQTQIHRNPGDYLFYQMLGDINFTSEWQHFEGEGTISSDQAGGYTIAFNCNVLKEVNNYYFRNIKFSVDEADLTEEERTAGTEAIVLPVPNSKDTQATATIDMTACVEALGVEDFKAFLNGETMKVQEAEGLSNAEYSAINQGAIFNENGISDEEGTICFEVADDSDNNQANFTIYNFGDKGFDPGQSVSTRICFVYKGWFYIYDVKFVGENDYEAALGIHDVTTQKANGYIYDLSGRRVKNPTKGIYIINGKKYVK